MKLVSLPPQTGGQNDGGCVAGRRTRIAVYAKDAVGAALPPHPLSVYHDEHRSQTWAAAPESAADAHLLSSGRDGGGDIQPVTDSTPIIRRLENDYRGRSIIPPDPATAFVDALIEDYGDEWLSKAMFHYRWSYPEDIRRGGDILPLWYGVSRSDEEIAAQGKALAERQISRLRFVGSNPATAPLIEQSYRRFIGLLDAHLRDHPYLMGTRPGASDFAVFGQLTQLALFDPTPMALTFEHAPRVCGWVTLIDDLSGEDVTDAGWFTGTTLPSTIRDILAEIGRTYVPVLLANAEAIARGCSEVEAIVDGRRWTQSPFPYQAKCLRWLQDAYAALDADARTAVDALLAGTGCEALIAH